MTDLSVSPTIERLRAAGAELHVPGDVGYDALRMPWNCSIDLRPAAVAAPSTVEEVGAVVRAAVAAGLRVVPMTTGHGAGVLTDVALDDVVMLRMHRLTGVEIDPINRTARVLGGTPWADVVTAAQPHGLTAAHGSAPDVGVTGYLLGGGLSFYGRRHGLAANLVRAVELVTADGDVVRADGEHHRELLWAARGGANVGIVVAWEIELLPYADVYAGMLLWDRDRAPDVVRTWAAWSRQAPESVTTSLRVMSFPPLPELPPFLSGRDVVVIDGVVLENDEAADAVLAELRELAPEVDTFGRVPTAAVLDIHMDPPTPTPVATEYSMLGSLDDRAVGALLAVVGPGTESGLMIAEVRHLGGAFSRAVDDGGVCSRIEGEYALHTVAVVPVPELLPAARAAGTAVLDAMAPWTNGSLVPSFTERREGAPLSAADRAELVRIRAASDPRGAVVANRDL